MILGYREGFTNFAVSRASDTGWRLVLYRDPEDDKWPTERHLPEIRIGESDIRDLEYEALIHITHREGNFIKGNVSHKGRLEFEAYTRKAQAAKEGARAEPGATIEIPHPPDELPNGYLLGRYKILRPLGKGGMARVYEAFDTDLQDDVAVKVLARSLGDEAEAVARFREEVKTTRRITHPNVCRIHEYGTQGGTPYYSMELVEGPTLKQWLEDTAFDLEMELDALRQIAGALDHMHENGVIHRDLSYRNILLEPGGRAVILDLGLAKDATRETITKAGAVLGTATHMSPEQVRGERATAANDVYSLGVIAYHMFARVLPFDGETDEAIMRKQLFSEPDMTPIPEQYQAPIRRALAKNAADRFKTAGEFVAALRSCAEPAPAGPAPTVSAVAQESTYNKGIRDGHKRHWESLSPYQRQILETIWKRDEQFLYDDERLALDLTPQQWKASLVTLEDSRLIERGMHDRPANIGANGKVLSVRPTPGYGLAHAGEVLMAWYELYGGPPQRSS